MTQAEWNDRWASLSDAYPDWKGPESVTVADLWRNTFSGFRPEVFDAAFAEFWESEDGARREPNQAKLRQACARSSATCRTPEQQANLDRFLRMTGTEKMRASAVDYRMRASRAETDYERDKWNGCAAIAEAAVRRMEANPELMAAEARLTSLM